MATVISDTPDGPVETDLATLSDDQLRMLAGAGVEEAQLLWLARRAVTTDAGGQDWQSKMEARMRGARGQA